MILKILVLMVLVSSVLGIQTTMAQLPTGESPFERTYTGIKILDAYFGTTEEKMEIEPGDFNAPFTVVLANVGNSDIVGLTGDLAMPINFGAIGSSTSMIRADTQANVKAGEHFTLTFYTDVGEQTKIGKYKGSVRTDYSRLRETGQRSEVFAFNFELVGRSIIDASAVKPFVSSLTYNDIVISLENTGSVAWPMAPKFIGIARSPVSPTMSELPTFAKTTVNGALKSPGSISIFSSVVPKYASSIFIPVYVLSNGDSPVGSCAIVVCMPSTLDTNTINTSILRIMRYLHAYPKMCRLKFFRH